MKNSEFQDFIEEKGRELYRDMPWRQTTLPYYVLVSEIMLQQTQVDRVIPKFLEFIEKYPDEKALARSDLASVLRTWQGLGYNRRAKYLHEAAKQIVLLGQFPYTEKALIDLPGVGKNTAGAILAYSFNQPAVFIETNIRTVYIHHFFQDETSIDDKQITEKLTATLDANNPRKFYWALMDYGASLKRSGVRNTIHSRQYVKQPPLRGSVREVRGQILTQLSLQGRTLHELANIFSDKPHFEKALQGLINDGLIKQSGQRIHLTK